MTVDTWEKLMTGISETVNTNNSVWPPRYLMSAHKIFSTFLTRPVREYSLLRPGAKYNLKLSFSGCQRTRFGIWKIMQNNYLRVTTKLQEEHIFVWSPVKMNLLGASISRRRLVIRRSGGMRHLLMRNSIHLTLFRVSISPYLHLTCCMSHATHVNTGGGEIKQMVDLCAVIIYTSKLLQKYLIHKSFHE